MFYVGSLFLLAVLLPYTAYSADESPFVTFFDKVGISGGGTMMNLVVLTAAFSSLNAGLYSTGRILRSMAMSGSAPKFTSRMSSKGVPYGGILLTASIGLIGVLLNGVVPDRAFESFSTSPRWASWRRGPPSSSARSSCTAGRSGA